MAWPSADPTSRDLTASRSRPSGPAPMAVTDQLEEHRVALTRYCHWKLGSADAEDAVQETFVRALHAFHRFEGRGTLQTWLYRIATNVCIDMLERRKRGARPTDFAPTDGPITGASGALAEVTWIERPYGRVDPSGDPADISESREAVERALAAALRYLPPQAARSADSPGGAAVESAGGRRTPRNQRSVRQQRVAARPCDSRVNGADRRRADLDRRGREGGSPQVRPRIRAL